MGPRDSTDIGPPESSFGLLAPFFFWVLAKIKLDALKLLKFSEDTSS